MEPLHMRPARILGNHGVQSGKNSNVLKDER